MGGRKNKNKNKEKGPGLTPAQRKDNARKSLKDQVELKQTLKRFQDIQREDQLLDAESAKLTELRKPIEEAKKECDKAKTECNQTIVLGTDNEKRAAIVYNRAARNAVNVNNVLKEELNKEVKKYASWYNSCIHMLDKEKIAKERWELLQASDDDKRNVEALKEEKKNAELKLKMIKAIYQQMTELDKERQINNSDLTLEEYMTLKHNRKSFFNRPSVRLFVRLTQLTQLTVNLLD